MDQIMALNLSACEVFASSRLTPQWRVGTGDGFAVAFPPGTSSALAVRTACSLFDKIHEQENFEIRLSLAQGLVVSYKNLLTKRCDIVGPAVIVARRLLDGAPSGSFLIEEHVAYNVSMLACPWKTRLVEHTPVSAKHGHIYRAHRYVPASETKSHITFTTTDPPITVELMSIARRLKEHFELALPNQAIQDIEKAHTTSLPALGGLILFWLDAKCKGLQPDMVTVVPKLGETATLKDWVQHLTPLPDKIQRVISPIATGEFASITDQNNRPKFWLRSTTFPLTDQPGLSLSIGGSDFRSSKALEWAFTHQVNFEEKLLTLREVYERGLLKLHEELFGLVAATIVMLTNNSYIVVAQRGDLSWAKDRYSISCEEGWDPNAETNPHKTVLRCLQEEWNLDAQHDVKVGLEHIRLVAIGREWGHYWNTVLIYVVELPCSSDDVIHNWVSFPKDACEATGYRSKVRNNGDCCLNYLPLKNCVRKRLRMWVQMGCVVGDGKLHETTGAARVLFALAHRFEVEEIAADVEKMIKARQSKDTAKKTGLP